MEHKIVQIIISKVITLAPVTGCFICHIPFPYFFSYKGKNDDDSVLFSMSLK